MEVHNKLHDLHGSTQQTAIMLYTIQQNFCKPAKSRYHPKN